MYSNKYSTNLQSLRLSVNVVFATVLGSIPASSVTVELEAADEAVLNFEHKKGVRVERKRFLPPLSLPQGVTKRCRLSWLTNSALVYEPNCGERGVGWSQPMSTAVHMEPK
jgi:hypothetical protein